ncbi:MAG: fumarylacetoacetate hydrolase family protein [Pseudomonadota bacterium]
MDDTQLSNARAIRIADALASDWEPRAPYRTLMDDLAPTDLTDAYRAQEHLQRKWEPTRGTIAGRKIALASAAMQDMVGIHQPVAGAIFAKDVHESGAEISLSAFRHLGLEYELAFEMAQDVDARVEAETVLDLVARVRPAFELIEDKGADYSALDVKTLVADNAWCGGIVLGGPIDNWRDLDLGNLPSVLSQNGRDDENGNTGAADPVNSLVWTLNHFTGRRGVVKAGEVIITGSVLKTRFPAPGDRLRYDITGHGAVEVAITA